MICEFKVKNYLSFKEEQGISFEATSDKTYEDIYCVNVKPNLRLLKLGVLYGANASGKTNLLNALEAMLVYIKIYQYIMLTKLGK